MSRESVRPHALRSTLAICLLLAPATGFAQAFEDAGKLRRLEQLRSALPGRGIERPAPETPNPPSPDVLSCGAPCMFGTAQASHPFYDVFLSCTDGSFTARTGAAHSVTLGSGGRQNVIFGGAGGNPGTSDIAFRVHDTATTYQDPTGGGVCNFNPPDTPSEPNNVGLEQEWTVSPRPGVTLDLRQEIVAFGSVENDSGIRLTLGITNRASSTGAVSVGVRWQIDYQNGGDDGPLYAPVVCDPLDVLAELSREHEFLPAEVRDFYRIRNNTGSPVFSNVTSTTSLAGFPDTGTPDRLIYGAWTRMVGSAWNYATVEGGLGPDTDSAVLQYFGYLPADGIPLGPGESMRRSTVIFTSAATVDCGTFTPTCATSIVAPPADRTICAGETTNLDGRGLTLVDCAGSVEYEWSGPGGVIATTPSANVRPADTTDYTLLVTCSTDPDCVIEETVTVTVERPPVPGAVLVEDLDPCNKGLLVSWEPATFRDPSGTGVYNLYRSFVSCADALASAPFVTGLTGTSYFDASVPPGVDTHYVVQAEDARSPTVCADSGPHHGGAVAFSCGAPTADQAASGGPDVLGAVLRLSHLGDRVTVRWPAARPLLPLEHFHLLKAWDDPTTSFWMVNPESDLSREHVETDLSSRLQFFDLRVADACEAVSADEFPPGWDP